MKCCENCFESPYLKSIITDSPEKGTCDFCQEKDAWLMSPTSLGIFFQDILSLYEVDTMGKNYLAQQIKRDFNYPIFSNRVKDKSSLLKAILADEYEYTQELFEQKVSPASDYENENKTIANTWERFKNEIRNENRFHISNSLNLKELGDIFDSGLLTTKIRQKTDFFRGRISDKDGFQATEMLNPPAQSASPGRANPRGISYLYLATDETTTIYETRAGKFDHVSVARIKNKEELKILNLFKVNKDPFRWIENQMTNQYLVYMPFLEKLKDELAVPIKQRDRELDYIPSQYITEFCKSQGFDGIAYDSSFSKEGYNYAMFYPRKFEVENVQVYRIDELKIQKTKL